MKANILTIDGKKKSQIDLPKCFSEKIRKDLIQKIIETKKVKQPYAPNPVAGRQSSASGKIIHKRHVWKSQYGRGMSRVPRKALSRKGSQFNWVGAISPNTRGGSRAHPPKAVSMINDNKINKKELRLALRSAISATIIPKLVSEKYLTLQKEKIQVPFIVESKLTSLKAKELNLSLKAILGNVFETAKKKKAIRAGKGKLRGRKYKKSLGMLIVLGDKEKLKSKSYDIVNVNKLSVIDLANGGVGRLTIYTEEAIKELGEKLK